MHIVMLASALSLMVCFTINHLLLVQRLGVKSWRKTSYQKGYTKKVLLLICEFLRLVKMQGNLSPDTWRKGRGDVRGRGIERSTCVPVRDAVKRSAGVEDVTEYRRSGSFRQYSPTLKWRTSAAHSIWAGQNTTSTSSTQQELFGSVQTWPPSFCSTTWHS
jgi:hypothetical protein